MPVLNIYKLDGSQAGTVELNNEIFGIEPNKTVMHEVLVAELAELRQGSTRAPHMVGGGVVHGPKPRNYAKKVNKKVRKLALRSALSAKINAGSLIVLDDFTLETPKTKTFVEFGKAINLAGGKQLFVINDFTTDNDYNLYLSVRNLKDTFVLEPRELSIYWLLRQDKIVVSKEALATIEEVLA